VRNVVIDNCVITDSNRGIAFMTFDGGYVSDLVISNCTIDCRRHDWFWRGDGDPFSFMTRHRSSELHTEIGRTDAPAGAIRNVLIKGVIAHGMARCLLQGHAEQWLEGIRFSDVRLFLAADPKADYDKEGSALMFRYARDVELHNVEVVMEDPTTARWKSPLAFEDASDILVDGFRGRLPRGSKEPAISLKNVMGALIRNSRVDPANGTLLVSGIGTRDVVVGTGVMPPPNEVEHEAGSARQSPKSTPARKPALKKHASKRTPPSTASRPAKKRKKAGGIGR
jgi:hypothetical protein